MYSQTKLTEWMIISSFMVNKQMETIGGVSLRSECYAFLYQLATLFLLYYGWSQHAAVYNISCYNLTSFFFRLSLNDFIHSTWVPADVPCFQAIDIILLNSSDNYLEIADWVITNNYSVRITVALNSSGKRIKGIFCSIILIQIDSC